MRGFIKFKAILEGHKKSFSVHEVTLRVSEISSMNDLYSLCLELKNSGIHNLCSSFGMSGNSTKIHIAYRDGNFIEQYISIERSRNTGYRISADKKPVIVRTKKAAFDYLQTFLTEAAKKSEKFKVITVAEYAELVGQIRYKQYVELEKRLEDLKRYAVYVEKQIKKGIQTNLYKD